MPVRFDRLALCALALAVVPSAHPRAADTEPGVWWEHTVEMQMQGMSMPATTQKICAPKNGMEEPPKSEDKNCQVTDVKHVGPKMTWKMKCTGKHAMTGEGEMVQGKNAYTGQMTMHMEQGDATMKMSGKMLGGDCDAGALKKQVAALQKQAKEQQAQADENMDKACEQAADESQLRMFAGPMGPCKKPEQLARACGRLRTRAGYSSFHAQARGDPELSRLALQLCKKDPETARAGLCAEAAREVKGDDTSDEVLDFLGKNCPDEAQAVAKKACAGRKFTGIPEHMRRICVKYAQEEMSKSRNAASSDDEDEDEPPPEKPKKEKAMDKGKKLLKGLF
jgi:hypothetical protein